jgi:hypothetical protein
MPKAKTKKAVKKKATPVRKKAATKRVVTKKAATKKAVKQTGTSSKFFDKLYQAKPPGKRKTKWGTTYYENRANRSDKGVLLGVDTNRYAMGNVNMTKQLSEIAKESKLKADVIKILKPKVKDYGNNYKMLLEEILQNGLQSGIINDLIYYSDTTKWYKKHKKDILQQLNVMILEYGTDVEDIFGKMFDRNEVN